MEIIQEPKKKVLLLGGAGFLGYYISHELHDLGHEVVIYDGYINFLDHDKSNYKLFLRERTKDLAKFCKMEYGDIRDTDRLIKVLNEHKPDVVVMLAAIPIANVCNQMASEALDINLNGTMSVLRALGTNDFVKRIIYSSSSFVYGNFQYAPCDEKHPCTPIDVYGGTKLATENLIKGFSTRYGREYVIVRPSAVYGPLDANRRVSQIFVENALLGKPITIHDPKTVLDFSYIKDTADGFTKVITKVNAANEVFNITRGEGRTLLEFAQIIKNLIPNVEIKTQFDAEEARRPVRGGLDIRKAREMLGYDPKYSIEKGLAEYIPFVKQKFGL